jgi:hypothetical protein
VNRRGEAHDHLVELASQDQAWAQIVGDLVAQTTSRCGKDSSVHCLHVGYTPGFQDARCYEQASDAAIDSTPAAGAMSSAMLKDLERHVESSNSRVVSSSSDGQEGARGDGHADRRDFGIKRMAEVLRHLQFAQMIYLGFFCDAVLRNVVCSGQFTPHPWEDW